jgi:hypothetical protein
MSDLLFCLAITAALTSLLVESPIGALLRQQVAGAPTEDMYEVWRMNGAHEETIPQARLPWLDEGMSCVKCSSAWFALVVVPSWYGLDATLSTLLVAWALAWLGARVVLGLVRHLEELTS